MVSTDEFSQRYANTARAAQVCAELERDVERLRMMVDAALDRRQFSSARAYAETLAERRDRLERLQLANWEALERRTRERTSPDGHV